MKKNILKITALALLTVMICAMLVACGGPNKDPEKAKEALEDAGYTVIFNDGGFLGDLAMPKGAEATITAVKGDDEYISIVYYEDKDALNEAWEDVKEDAEKLQGKYEDIVYKKSGNMIYIGTKQAVKDAR